MLTRVLGLTVGLLSLATQAQAQVLSIPAGTTGLSPLAGKITAVEQRRVALGEAVTGSETLVTLEFTLAACLDRLMPLVTHSEVKADRVTFYVTALNAHNQESIAATCIAPPKATAQVSVPGLFQQSNVKVVFLGQADSKTANPRGKGFTNRR